MNLSVITWKAKALAATLLATGLIAAGFLAGTHWVSGRFEAEKAAHERDRTTWTQQRLAGEIAERAKERAREDALREVSHVASLAQAHVAADRRAADVEHQRLSDVARAYAAVLRAGPGPTAAGGSEAAGGPLPLVDVLLEADAEAGDLAEALDHARVAGLACERAYDAIAGSGKPD